MSLLHLAVFAPFGFAIFVPFLYRFFRQLHTGWFVLLVPVMIFAYMVSLIPGISDNSSHRETMAWIPSLGIEFTLIADGLSLLFALLISGIGALVVLYSIYYLDKNKEALHSFYVYLLLFMGAMLGVVLSDNLLVMYMFWELTSISSFLLIAYWFTRSSSLYGALKSMLITVFGGFAMLAGIILLSIAGDTLSVRELIGQADVINGHMFFLPAMLLILLGAFTKSAQFPFHVWLPDAMAAPTPVSAYLHSATMVKAGIYLVARMTPLFGGDAVWFWLVCGFGLATLFWGSFQAVKQTDIKALLAFSTISQLGLIMSLLGAGSAALYFGYDQSTVLYTTAVLAAVFHLINHATFKGALFMVAGIIDHETGTRDIRRLGGLAAIMPISFTMMMIGTLSMAGLPPFNGFLSKELFFTGMLRTSELGIFQLQTLGMLLPLVAWIASIFTFVYSLLLLMETFLGKRSKEKLPSEPHEAPLGMLISPMILVALVIVIGFFPNVLAYTLIEPAMAAILSGYLPVGDQFVVNIYFWHGWDSPELWMTIGVAVVGSLLLYTRRHWTTIYNRLPKRFTINGWYDWLVDDGDRLARRLTDLYMTGAIRDYLVYIFAFLTGIMGWFFFRHYDFNWSFEGVAPIAVYDWLILVALVGAALIPLIAKSRLTAIIAVGVVGYMIALLFVLFRAPDLALTQLVIETVSVALFLLCFYHLPKLRREIIRVRFRLTNLIISLAVGAIVTLMALAALGVRLFDPISEYYVGASYSEAGGNNMVNVILVDFRGFDTLLEIVVLGIAALGIFSLIKLRMADDVMPMVEGEKTK